VYQSEVEKNRIEPGFRGKRISMDNRKDNVNAIMGGMANESYYDDEVRRQLNPLSARNRASMQHDNSH